MQEITCRTCGSSFQRRAVRGKRPQFCSLECKKIHLKAYLSQWNAENRDKVSAKRDANRDQVRAWSREFYARNRERRKELRRAIYKANPEKALAAARDYAKENPDRIRALSRKSRSKRRAIIARVFVESVDPAVVFERDRGMCGICMTPVEPTSKWEVDHVVPLSKGGAHAYMNVQLSHRMCNRSKGAA